MDNPETLDTLHSKKHITETYKKKTTRTTQKTVDKDVYVLASLLQMSKIVLKHFIYLKKTFRI